MIKPHGSDQLTPRFVEETGARDALAKEAASLTKVVVSSAAAANAVMLGAGYFTPLSGFHNRADALAIADNMQTTDGLFWPVPVLNLVSDRGEIKPGDRIALHDPNVDGEPLLAVQTVDAVETLTKDELNTIAERVFGTLDDKHPGVSTFMESWLCRPERAC